MLTLEAQVIGVRGGLAAAGTLMLCLSHPTPAPAASTAVLALELNEGPGASTAVDSSGSGRHGAIGSHVVMDGVVASFDRHGPTEGVAYRNEHLIVVPDATDASLDPGRGNFTVEVRFAYSESDLSGETPNLLQKGYSNTSGGQVKLQFSRGRIRCTFATSQGTASATSPRSVADGGWHVVRCTRTSTSLTLHVDGTLADRRVAATGALDNNKPWTVGGKQQCDAVRVDCDYFSGSVDYVRLTKG